MEKEIIELFKLLFSLNSLHQEIYSNDESFVVDAKKEGNTMTIKLTLKENKDKKEFEQWVQSIDNDLFQEIWESLSEEYGLKKLNDLYEGNDYKQVIKLFKDKGKQILNDKISKLQKLFD